VRVRAVRPAGEGNTIHSSSVLHQQCGTGRVGGPCDTSTRQIIIMSVRTQQGRPRQAYSSLIAMACRCLPAPA
jgi:hypothetical protein